MDVDSCELSYEANNATCRINFKSMNIPFLQTVDSCELSYEVNNAHCSPHDHSHTCTYCCLTEQCMKDLKLNLHVPPSHYCKLSYKIHEIDPPCFSLMVLPTDFCQIGRLMHLLSRISFLCVSLVGLNVKLRSL